MKQKSKSNIKRYALQISNIMKKIANENKTKVKSVSIICTHKDGSIIGYDNTFKY